MRVYGRINGTGPNGIGGQWVVVETDSAGYNDSVYLTALCQVLKLNLGEDPFASNSGVPATQSIITQCFPDFYIALTQQQYAQYFASLTITRTGTSPPTYQVNPTFHPGAVSPSKVAQ